MPNLRRVILKIAKEQFQRSLVAYAGQSPGRLPLEFYASQVVLVIIQQLADHRGVLALARLECPAPMRVPLLVLADRRILNSGNLLEMPHQNPLDGFR